MAQKWLLLMVLAAAFGVGTGAIGEQAASQPGVHRENTEWLDVWIPETNGAGLPRVLLIGDSITREYDPVVEKALKGKAFVARLATSKSLGDPALLEEVALVLKEQHFDVVHFNNGMHGHEYAEAQYGAAAPGLIETIRKYAPGAKLICATTTPTRQAQHLEEVGEYTERVVARNRIMTALCGREGIAVDDLFSVLEGHPEFYRPDGVHHVQAGIEALAAHVTEVVSEAIK